MFAHELKEIRHESRPTEVIERAVLLAQAVLGVPHLGTDRVMDQYKKGLLKQIYSFVTDANGLKYTSQWRSEAVIAARAEERKDVLVENDHIFPRIWITRRLLKNPSNVRNLLSQSIISCIVTRDEHLRLSAQDKQRRYELGGWERYRQLEIPVSGTSDAV